MIVEDLTTGPISGHFRRIAVPAAIGMLFSTLYNLVDTFFAGQIGTAAQAGLSIGYQALFLFVTLGFGLSSAMSALVGNARGAKDLPGARHLAAQGIGFAVIASISLVIAAHLAGPFLIQLVSDPGDYRVAAQDYYQTLILALPGFVMAYGGNGILQARGDTQSLQRALVVAFFVNIGLNPTLMYGIPGILPGLGVTGIALATAISQTGVAVFIMMRIFGRAMMQGLTRQDFRPVGAKYAAIASQAFPASLALLITFASGFLIQYALKFYGEGTVAAYGIAMRIEQLFLLPAIGITIALVPIAAQNYGAGHTHRVRKAFRLCCILVIIATACAFPVFWFFGGWATSFFSDDPAVIADGALFLRFEAVILPAYAIMFAINSVLQALKAADWTLWIGIYRQAIGMALFIWLFTWVFDLGVFGVSVGMATAGVTGLALALGVFAQVTRRRLV